jgi:hypothetical protein
MYYYPYIFMKNDVYGVEAGKRREEKSILKYHLIANRSRDLLYNCFPATIYNNKVSTTFFRKGDCIMPFTRSKNPIQPFYSPNYCNSTIFNFFAQKPYRSISTGEVSLVNIGTSKVTGDVSTITRDVSIITGDLSTVTWDASIITGDVSTITRDVSTITMDVSAVTGDVSTITGDVSIITRDVSTIKRDVSIITGDAAIITEDVSTNTGDVSIITRAVSCVNKGIA